MSVWNRWPALRWLVPGVAAVLVAGGGAAASAISASTEPDLPPRSAAELLVDLQTAQVGALSGTVVQTADLGLPGLPETDGHGSADLGSLWSGSHTLRVWYDGPERVRVALLGTLSQSDIIRNGSDLWIWESGENRASHRTLPEQLTPPPPAHHGGMPMTPQQAAEAALAAIEPTTEVSTDDTTRVAGRDAYELVLAPRDDASLIREVRLAIDAERGLPLGVEVYGDGADPAFEVEFTQISFDRPDPEQFRFNPPPGVTVTEAELLPAMPFGIGTPPEVTVVGEGWTSVVVARLPEDVDLQALEPFLAALPSVSGEWGTGRALAGELFSVLLTDDGRLLIGAVTPERLGEVAGDPAAALEGE
jgi:outer membrane lipoprotein-sorting protein